MPNLGFMEIMILLVVVLSQPFYFFSLDLPKIIVNKAIQGEGFDDPGATLPFFAIHIPLPAFLRFLGNDDGVLSLFDGIELERIPYLVAMSLLFWLSTMA